MTPPAGPAVPTERACHVHLAGLAALALAYYITARLGLLLAVPPGFSTAVWPASGIAAGALIVFGRQLWPGVLVGSFGVNVWMSFDASDSTAIVVCVAIGIGAALQALVGFALVRRSATGLAAMLEDRAMVRSLMLVGPLTCLVNASVGTGTLFAVGAIPAPNLLFNWWTWWVGDSIGVLVFVPLMLIAFARPRSVWRVRVTTVAVPLGLAFSLVVGFFALARTAERSRVANQFEREATVIKDALGVAIAGNLEVVHSVANLFASSNDVDRAEFGTFVTHALARHPSLAALSWNRVVSEHERAAFVQGVREQGLPGFRLTVRAVSGELVSAPDRPEHVIVEFIEPQAKQAMLLGFDVTAEAVRRAAVERARDTGEATATAPIDLIQGVPGCLVFLPIYRNGAGKGTLAERQAAIHGYATSVLRLPDLVQAALAHIDRTGVELSIRDAATAIGQAPPYAESGGVAVRSVGSLNAGRVDGLAYTAQLPFAGRSWLLDITPTQAFLAANRPWDVWLVLAGGMALVGMLGLFLLVISGRTMRITAMVDERTAQLSQAVAKLEQSNSQLESFAHIASHDLRAPLRAIHTVVGWIETDCGSLLPAAGREHLQMLRRRTDRMNRLLNDLLAYSRATSAQFAVEDLCVRDVLGGVVDLVGAAAGFPITITGDRVLLHTARVPLEHVVGNLLSNAIRHHDRATGAIEVHLQTLEGGVEISVTDDGPGIPPQYHQQVFLPFKTLKSRDKVEASGVGLAIVQKLVTRYGGTIQIESPVAAGRGTRFLVHWPCLPAVPQQAPQLPTESLAKPETAHVGV